METDDSFDFLFKIVLIGDMGVGKTCVVQRLAHINVAVFKNERTTTIRLFACRTVKA